MARTYSRPGARLGVLCALIVRCSAWSPGECVWSSATWTPKLALDLDGGTRVVLNAVPQPGKEGKITPATIDEAVKIIRPRVDGSGVAEAEVTTQGSDSIVVSLPGQDIDEATRNAIRRSAALEFRAVLAQEAPAPPEPSASASPTASATGSPSASPTSSAAASASAASGGGQRQAPRPAPSSSATGAGLQAATTPTPTPSAGGVPGGVRLAHADRRQRPDMAERRRREGMGGHRLHHGGGPGQGAAGGRRPGQAVRHL